MALAAAAISLVFVFLLPPFVFVLIVVLVSASVGKSLGLRERYVKGLIRIFEFCKTRLAAQRKLSNNENWDSDTESSEDEKPLGSDDEQAGSGNEVIAREIVLRPCSSQLSRTLSGTEDFKLWDPLYYVRTGVEAIVDDEVTKRFSAEELTSWNLLTRTNSRHQFVSLRLTVIWVVGFFVRYFVLLPIRVAILCVGTVYAVLGCAVIGQVPDGRIKRWLANCVFLSMFRILARAFSNVVYYHNVHNRPRSDGICVANHTSPIDCIVLAQDGCFSFVGQSHGGFLGLLQRALSRASSHIWFERSEAKDRYAVAKRLREHVEDPDKLPILIFPEGTCINNTSVMQFKKGTFEVGGTIYPVAIKYDPRFGDAFWNSSEYSMMSYVIMMMTSWAIVCDVWYLPPMTIRKGETSIDFANRVKAEIARQGGLVDLIWDGGLKRSAVKKEWREQYQQEFSRRLRLHSLSTVRRNTGRARDDPAPASVAAPAPTRTVDTTLAASSKPTSSILGNNSNSSGSSTSATKTPSNKATSSVDTEAASSVALDSISDSGAASIVNEPIKVSDTSVTNGADVLVNRKGQVDFSHVSDTSSTVNGDLRDEVNTQINNGHDSNIESARPPINGNVLDVDPSADNNNAPHVDDKCPSMVESSAHKRENGIASKCNPLTMPITSSVIREKTE